MKDWDEPEAAYMTIKSVCPLCCGIIEPISAETGYDVIMSCPSCSGTVVVGVEAVGKNAGGYMDECPECHGSGCVGGSVDTPPEQCGCNQYSPPEKNLSASYSAFLAWRGPRPESGSQRDTMRWLAETDELWQCWKAACDWKEDHPYSDWEEGE
jgi:hypothetical protein